MGRRLLFHCDLLHLHLDLIVTIRKQSVGSTLGRTRLTWTAVQVLLPRGGGDHQDLGVAKNNVYVRAPNPESFHGLPGNSSPTSSSLPSYRSPHNAHDPWGVLGDRLDLEKQDIQELAAQHNQSDIELPFARHHRERGQESIKGDFEAVERPEFDVSKHQRVVSDPSDVAYPSDDSAVSISFLDAKLPQPLGFPEYGSAPRLTCCHEHGDRREARLIYNLSSVWYMLQLDCLNVTPVIAGF